MKMPGPKDGCDPLATHDHNAVPVNGMDDDTMWVGTLRAFSIVAEYDDYMPRVPKDPKAYYIVAQSGGKEPFEAYIIAGSDKDARRFLDGFGVGEVSYVERAPLTAYERNLLTEDATYGTLFLRDGTDCDGEEIVGEEFGRHDFQLEWCSITEKLYLQPTPNEVCL